MKRKKGEGMIREYEPGKWLARITINGKQKAFYGMSEKEVNKKLKEFKGKVSMGLTDHKRIQYSVFLDQWLIRKKMELKDQSYYRLERTVNLHVKPILGFYFLDTIDANLIQDDVVNANIKKMSYSSLKKIYDAINSSLKYARSKGMIVHNPVELVIMPTSGQITKSKKTIEILTKDEIKRFAEVAIKKYSNGAPVYRNGIMFLFMLNTGLRMGEVCALKWSDYNDIDKTITVGSSIIQTKDEDGKNIIVEQKSVKTKNSERVLKLNTNAISAIPEKRYGEYIYCTTNGKPLRPRNVQNTLNSILEKANIPHKSTHVFRHTFASSLFERGYDVRLVSELLGHANVNTTYNTYIHLIKQQKAKAMESIEDMY